MKSIKIQSQHTFLFLVLTLAVNTLFFDNAIAHHVLGRPSYSLNEDSNTPPSMQVESQIGAYYITYMVYPAFPKPEEAGRVNLYIARIDNGVNFDGEVTFSVKDDSWFSAIGLSEPKEEILGTQGVYDGVYRQGFLFKKKGSYIIAAFFESGGQPYTIDFPLQVGESSAIGPIGLSVTIIIFTLLGVNIFQRRRLMQAKIRARREENQNS